jgi:hypothetical protein
VQKHETLDIIVFPVNNHEFKIRGREKQSFFLSTVTNLKQEEEKNNHFPVNSHEFKIRGREKKEVARNFCI